MTPYITLYILLKGPRVSIFFSIIPIFNEAAESLGMLPLTLKKTICTLCETRWHFRDSHRKMGLGFRVLLYKGTPL